MIGGVMTIIYKLTNLEKNEGRRFYIGSKAECFIETVDGVDRIVSAKNGKLYYGSSTCATMKADMEAGHRFHAEILEEVPDKKFLLEVENKWIIHFDAASSADYYNISYAVVGGHSVDQSAMYNSYGETIMEYGKITSSLNKKDNTARRFGFKNLGEFCVWIHNKQLNGYNGADMAKEIDWERHSTLRYAKDYDMPKCVAEYLPSNEELQKEIRLLIAKGVSAKKVAEIKGLEIPTVFLYLGDYQEIHKKSFLVAQRRGQTKEELEVQVTKRILDGAGFQEVSRELGINMLDVKRYFLRCVRQKLKSSDL